MLPHSFQQMNRTPIPIMRAASKPASVPYSPGSGVAHPLCKDCKFFQTPAEKGVQLRYGLCTKYGEMNLVDGIVDYDFAIHARPHKCKGTDFEPASSV